MPIKLEIDMNDYKNPAVVYGLVNSVILLALGLVQVILSLHPLQTNESCKPFERTLVFLTLNGFIHLLFFFIILGFTIKIMLTYLEVHHDTSSHNTAWFIYFFHWLFTTAFAIPSLIQLINDPISPHCLTNAKRITLIIITILFCLTLLGSTGLWLILASLPEDDEFHGFAVIFGIFPIMWIFSPLLLLLGLFKAFS